MVALPVSRPKALHHQARQRSGLQAQQQPLGNGIAGAPSSPPQVNNIFTGLERAITATFNGQNPGQRNDWK